MAPRTLSNAQLNRALLARQQLLRRKRTSVVKTIHAVGGLQTQEPRDAYISLWSRVKDFDRKKLERAVAAREVVRGSWLRCTIHSVSSDDYIAFRLLLQAVIGNDPMIRALAASDAQFAAIAELLGDDDPRSARQIGDILGSEASGATPEEISRMARFLVPLIMAPTDDRWGYSRPPRFVLAERWLGGQLEASTPLSALCLRGIAAIGPASSSDLRAWSGMKAIKVAIEELRPQLMVFRDERGRELFDLPDAPRPRADTPAPVRFLGEFDNVALSHADRSRITDAEDAKRFNVSKNGRRANTILIDGRIRASWRISRKADTARLAVTFFNPESKQARDEVALEAEALLKFMEPDAHEFAIEIA